MPTLPEPSTKPTIRRAALDIAAAEVVANGWPGLHMRGVATQLGVSRQTLYNTFGDKHGLAEALILDLLERFLSGIDEAVAQADSPEARWQAVVRFSLQLASVEPLLTSALAGPTSADFLPLLTSESGPVIRRATSHLVRLFRGYPPQPDAGQLADAAETITRLTLSHLVCPQHPIDQVARHAGRIAMALVAADVPAVA